MFQNYIIIFKIFLKLSFRERGKERKREKERETSMSEGNINWLPLPRGTILQLGKGYSWAKIIIFQSPLILTWVHIIYFIFVNFTFLIFWKLGQVQRNKRLVHGNITIEKLSEQTRERNCSWLRWSESKLSGSEMSELSLKINFILTIKMLGK